MLPMQARALFSQILSHTNVSMYGVQFTCQQFRGKLYAVRLKELQKN